MRTNQLGGCSDQSRVIPCLRTVRQQRDIFQSSTDTVPSIEPPSIDCPTRYAVSVVNLLQGDARGQHDIFHASRVLNSNLGIEVKRFDQDPAAPGYQSRTYKCARIITRQQSSFDIDTPGK